MSAFGRVALDAEEVPAPGNGPMCADVHVWGPRIAGVAAQPYAMIEGDLKPGNVIGGRR